MTAGWQPKKGDRVMFSDAAWAAASSQRRSIGRRAGVIARIRAADDLFEAAAYIRWDGSKNVHAGSVELSLLAPADLENAKDLKPPPVPKKARGMSAWEKICWNAQEPTP